jgi:hypothetical protein
LIILDVGFVFDWTDREKELCGGRIMTLTTIAITTVPRSSYACFAGYGL